MWLHKFVIASKLKAPVGYNVDVENKYFKNSFLVVQEQPVVVNSVCILFEFDSRHILATM